MVRIDRSREAAWQAIAGLALDLRDYPRAEQAHRELVRLDPRNVAAWLRLGATLARLERWAEAREAIARAQALDPKAAVDEQLVRFLEQKAAARPPAR